MPWLRSGYKPYQECEGGPDPSAQKPRPRVTGDSQESRVQGECPTWGLGSALTLRCPRREAQTPVKRWWQQVSRGELALTAN